MTRILQYPRTPSAFVIGITTFDSKGALDEGAFREHCQRMVAAGIGFYAGGSSPGEQYNMEPKEVERTLAIAVEVMKDKVPVRAMGVEPRNASEMHRFLDIALASGVDAIQIYSLDLGHGNRPSLVPGGELETYFRTAIEYAKGFPVIPSSHMAMGYNIPVDMVARLVNDYENVIGLSYTSMSIPDLSNHIDAVGDKIDIHVGGQMHALACLGMGGAGYLTSDGNVLPRLSQAVINHWQAGNHVKAGEAYHHTIRFSARPPAAQGGASVRWTKLAMKIMGLKGYHLSLPYLLPEANEEKLMRQHMEQHNLIELETVALD